MFSITWAMMSRPRTLDSMASWTLTAPRGVAWLGRSWPPIMALPSGDASQLLVSARMDYAPAHGRVAPTQAAGCGFSPGRSAQRQSSKPPRVYRLADRGLPARRSAPDAPLGYVSAVAGGTSTLLIRSAHEAPRAGRPALHRPASGPRRD